MVREALISDFSAVSALEAQVFNMHYEARPDMIKPRQAPFDKGYFEKCLMDDNAKIFVFEEDGVVLGHCITRIREHKDHPVFYDMKILEIVDLCVDERSRRKRIGQQLFERAKMYAKEIGAFRLELMVWDFNKNARQFYEHLGMSTRIRRMDMSIE